MLWLIENIEVVWKALRAFDASSVDFCDDGCERTITFDKIAASLPKVLQKYQ